MKLFNNDAGNNYIEIINDYFNQWQSIKNTEQHKYFFSKMPPTFGMFETSILNQINHFLEIGVKVECNNIILTDFKNEVKNMLEDLQIYN
jgi:hypothetical protein